MEHQERALAAFVADQRAAGDATGVIVVGSVARGTEREDSDVDVYLVVPDQAFRAALADNRVAWTERDDVDYPGGYVDVKLTCPWYLAEAARHGDDPTRASFEGARVAWSRDPGLARAIEAVTRLDEAEWDRRAASHLAQVRLHGGYFLEQADAFGDDFLRVHATTHLALAVGRLALATSRRFLRGPKYVSAAMAELPVPPDVAAAWHETVADASPEASRRLVAAVEAWTGDVLPAESTLSTFIRDNELAWLRGTLPAEYA
ncbi:nucleotidyltransferase domain-containing protein [Agromyces sp. SYSU T00194]|uniref:nucleotidyltransferase domain-containing protein n=1 Tax=Agromyces chitinivorans TaxID=3158560 RepID=UPI0033990921